jgi:benzoate-CoA ligase
VTLRIPAQFNLTAHFLDRPAAAHPARAAIAGVQRMVTYAELRAMANRVGNALRKWWCKPGDRVLIALPDCAEFMAAFFGAAKIGAIAVPVNPLSRPEELKYFAADCGARVAFVTPEQLDSWVATSAATPDLYWIIVTGRRSPDFAGEGKLPQKLITSWESWLGDVDSELCAAPTAANDPAFFLYTSGSTGGPKAAVHQHKDMLVTSETFARGILGITCEDRCFSVSKLFFAYGLGNGMYFPLGAGACTILEAERPQPAKVLETVAGHKPTLFFSVPTFYAALLREAEGRQVDFSSVRLAVSAGEALPVEIFEKFKLRFGLEILDAIGSTEMLHMFISNVPGKIRPGSCGLPLPGYDAQIVDEQGRPVATGEIGNLWVRGQSAFAEYWKKPEKTAQALRPDGWVVTGDTFHQDADGYHFYDGRADDMLKVAGMWVAPAEVENALLSHAAVAEAAVVGKQLEGLTRMVGYVVLRAGCAAHPQAAEEIRQWVRTHLLGYKCPQEIHFVEALPKTATGKIQRFRLRQGA